MSSNYMKINGKNYLSKMIHESEEKADSKKNSNLSLNDARVIFKGLSSESLTETEIRTVSYILEKYSFTEPALKWIEKILSQSDNYEDIHETGYPDEGSDNCLKSENNTADKKEKPFLLKKIIITLIVLAALIAAAGFFLIKKEKTETVFSITEDDKLPVSEEEVVEKEETDKSEAAKITPVSEEAATEVKPQSKLYVVQNKDTLIKISIDIYGDYSRWNDIYNLNKDVLKNPALVFPGQELKLP